MNITNPFQTFFHFYASDDAIQEFIAGIANRSTDNNVWLEYSTPRNMVEMGLPRRSKQQSLGAILLQAGGGQRLKAFTEMLPGIPLDALVSESLKYQYGMELGVDRSGAVDLWADERNLQVQALRLEIQRRNDSGLD